MLGLLTLALVAVFARFEWAISEAKAPAAAGGWSSSACCCWWAPRPPRRWSGIAAKDGGLDWWRWTIPVAAVVGAALLGALAGAPAGAPGGGPAALTAYSGLGIGLPRWRSSQPRNSPYQWSEFCGFRIQCPSSG